MKDFRQSIVVTRNISCLLNLYSVKVLFAQLPNSFALNTSFSMIPATKHKGPRTCLFITFNKNFVTHSHL